MTTLKDKLAEREHELATQQRQLDLLTSNIEGAKRNRQALEDLWGAADGKPLPGRPLYAAITAVIASNLALFFGYVVYLSRGGEVPWDVLCVIAVIVTIVALPSTGLPGAGGRARVGLRRVAFVFLFLTIFEVVIAFSKI
jgi:hypothetical protein